MKRESVARPRDAPGAERRAVLALSGLAVAQPIFDQLGRNPEFLWLRDIEGLSLWAFSFGLFLGVAGLALLLSEGAGRLHFGLRLPAYRLWIWLGLGLLALLVVRRFAPDLSSGVAFAAAGLGATLGTWVHAHKRAARQLGSLLSLAVWVIPLLFAAKSTVRSQGSAPAAGPVPIATQPAPPILLIVFDELPIASILGPEGEIDDSWFPGFARLASTSTWYRDTLTTSTMTLQAIPALLSGRLTKSDDASLLSGDDRTLFQLVGESHQRFAYTTVGGVVPRDVALLSGDRPGWGSAMEDLGILYLHLTMPRSVRERLPPVSAAWGEFAGHEDEPARLRRAIDGLERKRDEDGRPLFAYIHSALPHHPWTHLQSGARYWGNDHLVAPGFSGVADIGQWTRDSWAVAQAYQRHVLQTMYTDRLLGELIDRLVELESWDSALVVVTADHGASFSPGQPLRAPTDSTLGEAAAVPLFVKLPGQSAPIVSDRRASVVDILPTIADAYGQSVPWPVDGVSLLQAESAFERERLVEHPTRPPVRVARDLFDEILAVSRARRRFFANSDEGKSDPYRIGPYSRLVGLTLADFELLAPQDPLLAERIDPERDERRTRARLRVRFDSRHDFSQPRAFAVTVGHEVVATTMVSPLGQSTLSVLIPEPAVSRSGDHPRLFEIVAAQGQEPRLAEVRLDETTYEISADGSRIIGAPGESWRVDPGAFQGLVHVVEVPNQNGASRLLAWAVDDRGRAPDRLVVFAGNRSLMWAPPGVPQGDFLDYLAFKVSKERVFYLALAETVGSHRYFALGADGRAGEISLSPAP